jgi:PAS domain S-box-containing protein
MSAEGTARKPVTVTMSESDERFRAVFSQAAVGMAQVSLEGTWLLVNNRLCEMLGYSEAELREKSLQDITHSDDWPCALAGRQQLLAGEISAHSMEKRYVRKDGTIVWARLHRSLVRDRENRPKYFNSVIEDITEKVQADRALRDSEQRLSLAQRAAHLGVWDWNMLTGVTTFSGEYAALHGLEPDHPPLTHEAWLRLVHPADRERVETLLRESIEQTHDWNVEFRVVWPDGSIHWLLGKGAVFLGDDGQPLRMTGVTLDFTERQQAVAALRESEERFRNMADAAPVMVWVSGLDKLCTFFNKGWLDLTGRTMEQSLGNGWASDVHPDDLERCLATYSSSFDERRSFEMEYRLRRADGAYRWVIDRGVPRFTPAGEFAGYIGSGIDITDLKQAQEEALARQKLESLAVLAGGIAHDFNNLLGGILAEAELVEADLAVGSAPREEIERIKARAVRGSEIIRELMIYAGEDQTDLVEAVDVSELVEEMQELVKTSISKHAVVRANLHDDLPAVWGNTSQIRQVVVNLLINASEAIGEEQGVITITTAMVSGGRELAPNNVTELPFGNYVLLEVSDTGSGITEEARAKIFDPFFSSKFPGRGLGLAVVLGIVQAHGGAINLMSAPGEGTTFQVFLPCSPRTS